jgi:hypothetical protein
LGRDQGFRVRKDSTVVCREIVVKVRVPKKNKLQKFEPQTLGFGFSPWAIMSYVKG